MLMPRYQAPSIGYSYVYINGGKMTNQGVEFQANIHALDMKKGGWHALSAMEQDLMYVAEAEGVQARLPFVVASY